MINDIYRYYIKKAISVDTFTYQAMSSIYSRRKLLHNGHQVSGVKLEKFFISYRRLKNQKYSVSIGLSCSGFSFYEHFNRKFTYVVFYIQNRQMCLSKKILYQYFIVFFCPAWDRLSSENILYVFTLH